MEDDVVARLADHRLKVMEKLRVEIEEFGDGGEHPAHEDE